MPRRRKAAPFMWPDYRSGRPEWHIVDYESYVNEGFNINTLVYASIMYKVRALSQVPLRAYEGDVDHPEQLNAEPKCGVLEPGRELLHLYGSF
jgi:phage portal protein BeeE